MDITFVKAFDLPSSWYKCLKEVLERGYEYTVERGSFVGHKRKELDFVLVQITNPSNRPLIPEIPKELEDVVPAPTTMDYVNEYLGSVFAPKKELGEAYTYGERLSNPRVIVQDKEGMKKGYILGVNQIEEAIKIFKSLPNYATNQVCMEIGLPTDIKMKDPPCMRLIDLKVKDGKLNFVVYLRSWDLYAGYPANLATLQLLKEYMAEEIGIEDGELIASSKGLHLYDYQWKWAEALLFAERRRLKRNI